MERLGASINNKSVDLPLDSVDLSMTVAEPPTEEELKAACRATVTRIFADALPSVAQEMVRLATQAETETVRFRAANRVIEEFKAPQRGFQPGGTNVQIINAIPFERSAYEGKKELQTVQIDNLRMAIPKYKKLVPTGDDAKTSTRDSFAAGKKLQPAGLDKLSMDRIGAANSIDPEHVPVK